MEDFCHLVLAGKRVQPPRLRLQHLHLREAAPSYQGPYLGERRARLALPARLAKRGGRCLRIPRALCALRSCAAAVTCRTAARGAMFLAETARYADWLRGGASGRCEFPKLQGGVKPVLPSTVGLNACC